MSLARNLADLGSSATALDKVGSNLIMNGAMLVDQRNSGSAVTPTDGVKTLDRFSTDVTATGKFSVQQVSDGPDGFINSFKVTSLSAYSVSSSDFLDIAQNIEGLNVSHLNLGSSNAKVITLSFYVKSSLTGTFGGSLTNSAYNRSYPYTYTISSADTWERKTITLTGDTSGTWLTTNGVGLRVVWSMGAGSSRINTAGAWVGSLALGATGQTNVVATNAATWQITGCQLEVGGTATDFEHRSYADELQACRRYYQVFNDAIMTCDVTSGNHYYWSAPRPVVMRTAATQTFSGTLAVSFTAGSVTDSGSTSDTFSISNLATATAARGYYAFDMQSDAEL